MESTTLDINVVSARDLNEVNLVSKMDVYVVVSLASDSPQKQKVQTNADRDGGRNPNWNFPMKFSINELATRQNREILVFTIRCQRTFGDRDVGEVHVPVVELLQSAGDGNPMRNVSYAVRKPSGKIQGVLNFQYKFRGNVGGSPVAPKDDKPAAACGTRGIGYPPEAYPPPPPMTGYGGHPSSAIQDGAFPSSSPSYDARYATPPNTQPYGYPHYIQPAPVPSAYGYPPQPGYPHPPPPPHGYNGYPPAPNIPPKDKKLGKMFGVGAGLLGGMIGGLLLGDLATDIGSAPSFGARPQSSGHASYDASLKSSSDSMNMLGTIG